MRNLAAHFGSWMIHEDEEELLGAADPELVAALQFLASLLDAKPGGDR